MKNSLVIVAVLLAGCAALKSGPSVIEGTPRSVTVELGTDSTGRFVPGPTLMVAEQHCAKYGKHAKYAGRPLGAQVSYDCVD